MQAHAVVSSCGPRSMDCCRHDSTSVKAALDLEVATEHADALLHPRKTDPFARPVTQRLEGGRVESTTKVTDLQIDFSVGTQQLDNNLLRPDMLSHVGQCLLRDMEDHDLHVSRQALVLKVFLVVDLIAFFPQMSDLQGNGGRESEVINRCQPQVCDASARFQDSRPVLLEDSITFSPALLSLWGVATGEGLRVLMCGYCNLG